MIKLSGKIIRKSALVLLVFGTLMGMGSFVFAADDVISNEDRIEINVATKEQLLGLGVISSEQIDMIIEFRENMGDFMNFEELIDAGLDQESVDKLLPYITINFLTTDCSC